MRSRSPASHVSSPEAIKHSNLRSVRAKGAGETLFSPGDHLAEKCAEVVHTQGEENVRGQLSNVLNGDAITGDIQQLEKEKKSMAEGREESDSVLCKPPGVIYSRRSPRPTDWYLDLSSK